MQYASSKNVRRNVTVTLALAALLAFGAFRGLKEVSDFRAYQDSLPPSGQLAFSDLPFWRQLQIYDAAQKLGLSPKALEFYLNESARLGNLPLEQALKVSSLAERSGQGGFVLDYVTRNGEDPAAMNALLNTSPRALSRYADLAKAPNSLLNEITPQQGLNIANGKVVQVDPALAMDLAAEIAKATGKDAWGSPVTGQVYFPESSPRAWVVGRQLIAEGPNSPNVRSLMQIISEESVRGKGNGFQLGPFMVKDPVTGKVIPTAGVERGVYIQDALNKGVKFYDMGDVYYALKDAGFTDQQLWSINEGTIQNVMKSKTPIEFVYTDIDVELNRWKGRADSEVPIRIRELRWIIEHADEYDYIRDGNHWTWQPNP